MPEITLTVSEAVAGLLDALGAKFGQTREQIAAQILATHEQVLNPPPRTSEEEAAFRAAMNATLEENAELYRRLANS